MTSLWKTLKISPQNPCLARFINCKWLTSWSLLILTNLLHGNICIKDYRSSINMPTLAPHSFLAIFLNSTSTPLSCRLNIGGRLHKPTRLFLVFSRTCHFKVLPDSFPNVHKIQFSDTSFATRSWNIFTKGYKKLLP